MQYTRALAASLAALTAAGWPAVFLIAAIALALVPLLCWVLNDGARTRRATTLIDALRRSRFP